jgi:hypothetical protein
VPSIWKEAGVGSFFEVSGKAPDRDPDLLDIRFFEIIHLAANHEKLSSKRESSHSSFSPRHVRRKLDTTLRLHGTNSLTL